MLGEQEFWDTRHSESLSEAQCIHHHHSDQNIYNRSQHVGKAVIYKYKSPHFLEPSMNNPMSRLDYLTHCQRCLNPFQQPVTLSCGFTLCHQCLPASNQCLSFSCLRSHKNVDYKPTIIIENILSQCSTTAMDIDNNTLKSLLDCSICLSTLTEPITTQCGHTFCKECLIRTMTDMNSRSCPFCRTEINRIGKANQLITSWINYLNSNNSYYYHDESMSTASSSDSSISLSSSEDEPAMSTGQQEQHHIPIIQVTSAVAFPTQHCLFHITKDKLSLLQHMIHRRHEKHYAICVFSKPLSASSSTLNEFYEYGIMLQIDHIEHLPDIRHSVVQATGLFRLRINQLTVDFNECYTGDVTRLDDLVENNNIDEDFMIDRQLIEQTKSKRWTMPTTVITTQSTPATPTTSTSTTSDQMNGVLASTPTPSTTTTSRKMVRPRPCSMRLSSSAPNNFHLPPATENFTSANGPTRRAWGSLFSGNKPSSPPLSFSIISNKKHIQQQQQQSKLPMMNLPSSKSTSTTTTFATLNQLFDQELHPYIIHFLTTTNNNVWMMQYDWYLQNSDRSTLIWWIANVLPLEYNEKIILLSMETLRERIMTLIAWTDKWRSD